MEFKFKRTALAIALALPVAALHAQQDRQSQQQRQQPGQQMQQGQQQASPLRNWDAQRLYRNTWSADEMIGANVRGQGGEEIGEVKDIIVDRNGNISKVVVEVGGFFEMGDQHIGVPWRDVRVGPEMQYIQVPLREVENGTYSLHGRVPQGEDVFVAQGAWRVNELIGDYASLEDMPRYGIVTDVIFDDQGSAQGVIVNRTAGSWGRGGWYGYPFYGYYHGAYNYPLPYRSSQVGEAGRFDYVELANTSRYSSDQNRRAQQQARAEQREGQRAQQGERQRSQQGAAAGGTQSGHSKDLVMQVQRQLNSRGFDAGTVSGELNSRTHQALRNFQEKRGIQASGELNPQTLTALGLESR